AELLKARQDILRFDGELKDFAETAGLVSQLDLVISVDTSVAHLAGALGKPVWLLLPYVPDWRWLLDREDSPWYPTLRLFRQSRREDWGSVFVKIEQELRTLLEREPKRSQADFAITPSRQIEEPGPAASKVKADLQHAVVLRQRGQLAEAERIYQEILKIAPDDFDATHFLGVLLTQRGRPIDGEQLIARALKINPNAPSALNNRGLAL